jgi:hypothetical protein
MSDHDQLQRLDQRVEDLSVALDRQTETLLARMDSMELHWQQRCDLRHAETSKRATNRFAKISIMIAAIGLTISAIVAVGNCAVKARVVPQHISAQ